LKGKHAHQIKGSKQSKTAYGSNSKSFKKPNFKLKAGKIGSKSSLKKSFLKAKFNSKPKTASKLIAKATKKLSAKPSKAESKKAKELKAAARDKERKRIEKERADLELKIKQEAYARQLELIKGILSQAFARQVLVSLAGENSLEIIKSFDTNLSDEEISKRLKLKISDVRATLNKLHGEGLVSYFRDKNSETGWYSYTWMANGNKIDEWVSARVSERKLSANIESDDHYFCPACGINSVHGFEIATSMEFKCHICSKNLEFLDEEKRNELVFGRKTGRD
jgi:transcription factor E